MYDTVNETEVKEKKKKNRNISNIIEFAVGNVEIGCTFSDRLKLPFLFGLVSA